MASHKLQTQKLLMSVLISAFFSLAFICSANGAEGDAPDTPDNAGGIFAAQTQPVEPVEDLQIPDGQSVQVGSFGQIDLHVKDLDLTRVLQLLSIQSQRNIIASRNVAGSVSADLYSVDFYDALDAILQPNGFGFREKGQFIYVYTSAEIKEIEEAERKLTHRVIRLNYLTAEDASVFVTPLLSTSGSISVSGAVVSGMQPSTGDGGANSFSYADTMVIRDYPENVEEIIKVIKDLDIRPKQVLIEATILEAQLQENNAFGVDFSILVDKGIDELSSPLNAVDQLISGRIDDSVEGLQSTVGSTVAGDSGFKLGVLGNDFSVFLRALDRVTDTTVVANPKLLVLNRQRADLLVGAKLGYLSTTATETATTQTVDFLEVGTQLSVRPFVSEEDFIRMELKPSISDGTTTAIEGVVIPNETTEEMTTNIMVRNGQTIVMGGLFKEDTTTSRNQVPGLGDMPFVGAAFQGYDDETSRSEVIFLIKPTVMKDSVLYEQGERARNNVEITRIGAREGLLPWSRSRLVSGHLRKAIEEHGKGNKKKALWWTNLALSLEPRSIEARRLKEQLTGERIYWPDGSALLEAVDKTVDIQLEESAQRAEAHAKQVEQARQAALKAREDRYAAREAARQKRIAARNARREMRLAEKASQGTQADSDQDDAAPSEPGQVADGGSMDEGSATSQADQPGVDESADPATEAAAPLAVEDIPTAEAEVAPDAASEVVTSDQVESPEPLAADVDDEVASEQTAEPVAEVEEAAAVGFFGEPSDATEGESAAGEPADVTDAEAAGSELVDADNQPQEQAVTELPVDQTITAIGQADDPDASHDEAVAASKSLDAAPDLDVAASDRASDEADAAASDTAVADGDDGDDAESVAAADEQQTDDAETGSAQADAGSDDASDEDATAAADSETDSDGESSTAGVTEPAEAWSE